MRKTFSFLFFLALVLSSSSLLADKAVGWLHWRGPHQNGTSQETGLPSDIVIGGKNHLWTYNLAGAGAPVIANDRLYAIGFRGEGPDLQEILVSLDAKTGKLIWEHGFNDFLSDIVYNRYAIGSPTVDPETGNIYIMTAAGDFACFNPEGDVLWQVSMMERFGMLTFPNGRRGAAVIEGDLVIHHCITSYWGSDGPARDRFYAFNKRTGDIVWSSTPGIGPKDSSFSSPVLAWANGKRVFYAGTGCGNLVCVNALTGQPLWRFHMSYGGVNATPVLFKDRVIAIHGKENVDGSEVGRMVAIRVGADPGPTGEQKVLGSESELWRNPLVMFTSSPVLVEDRIYQVTHTGELACVDIDTGNVLWEAKLDNSQLHASPLYADGKLYIPMVSGTLYIIEPNDEGLKILNQITLDGKCLGAPSVWNGRIYVHSSEKLYCFGSGEDGQGMVSGPTLVDYPTAGEAQALRVVPSDVLLHPGQEIRLNVSSIDAKGLTVQKKVDASIEKWIPPTARVQSRVDADINGTTLNAKSRVSAGSLKATFDGLTGYGRARLLPDAPFSEDFESFQLTTQNSENDPQFAYPPLPWIGARFKWEIRDVNGNKALAKTLDNVLFQRAITFIGHPEMQDYTVEADVMTDGNRRMKSNIGVINQRYMVVLIGNAQILEVSSNHDRVKVSVPFKWNPGTWYRLKTRVDVADDGSGVVRAKAWEKGQAEPSAWNIEVPHRIAHKHGAPGLLGFSPQSRFSVYVDNVKVTQN